MNYKKVICPVDGSELSDRAIQEAAYVCKATGATLVLLHVVEKWYRSAHMATDSEEWHTIHDDWIREGKNLLNSESAKVADKSVKIVTVLKEGDASHEIIATAIAERADLIVMATKRYSPIGKLFAGSHTDKVTRNAPCPVLWIMTEK